MDLRASSNQAWIQIYNTKLFYFPKLLEACGKLWILGNTYGYDPTKTVADRLNVTTAFNLYWENIVVMTYQLVKEGHFGLRDLMKTDYFFVEMLYDQLDKDFKEQKKRADEENEQREAEQARQQQLYNQSFGNIMNGGGYNIPNYNN